MNIEGTREDMATVSPDKNVKHRPDSQEKIDTTHNDVEESIYALLRMMRENSQRVSD